MRSVTKGWAKVLEVTGGAQAIKRTFTCTTDTEAAKVSKAQRKAGHYTLKVHQTFGGQSVIKVLVL